MPSSTDNNAPTHPQHWTIPPRKPARTPRPGTSHPDNNPESTTRQEQGRAAYQKKPHKEHDLACRDRRAPCDGCAASHTSRRT
ncbi:hypothetical protein ACFV80_40895 [Streptomyces sp. NPDC059862]|uniref:hypothetical protein n=1 Tax=Streptomyces sp. NPDC059862 TaxID=3346975 RepID=UPI0036587089